MDSDRGLGVGIIFGVIIAVVLFFGSIESLGLPLPWSFMTAVKVLVSVAFLVVLGIAGWIGWTMASTPTPEAVEDVDLDEMEDIDEEIGEPFEPEEDVSEGDIRDELTSIKGVTEDRAESLISSGYDDVEALRDATEEELTEIEGIGSKLAERIKEKYA